MTDYNDMTYEQAEDVLNNPLHVNVQDEMGGHAVYLASVALEKQSEWIPVTEDLPVRNSYVLVTTRETTESRYRYIRTAKVNYDGEWEIAGHLFTDDEEVIAWQPLPRPYNGEVDNGR